MIDFKGREFDVPIVGTKGYRIVRLRLNHLMVNNAVRIDFPENLHASAIRRFVEAVFLENLDSLPLRSDTKKHIRRILKGDEREEFLLELAGLINWDEISLVSLVLSEISEFERLKRPA